MSRAFTINKNKEIYNKKLIKISSVEPEDDENHFLYTSLGQKLFDLIRRDLNISGEDFKKQLGSWAEKNSSILEPLTKLMWSMGGHETSTSGVGYNANTIETRVVSMSSDKAYIISKADPQEQMNKLNENGKIKESYVLLPEGDIPKLFLWIVNFGLDREPVVLPAEVAHNHFIFDVVNAFFYGRQDPQAVNKFIKENEEQIKKIRRLFSSPEPELLGSGVDGVAFKINDTMVLKIFRSKKSYEAAKKAMERLYSSPLIARTEANIYDAGILGEYLGNTLYYYIIELMTSTSDMPEDLKDNLKRLISIIRLNVVKLFFNKNYPDFEKISNNPDTNFQKLLRLNIDNDAKEIAIKLTSIPEVKDIIININDNLPELRKNWFKNLIAEIINKYVTGRIDLHIGNIGITNYGDFRYFDPVY